MRSAAPAVLLVTCALTNSADAGRAESAAPRASRGEVAALMLLSADTAAARSSRRARRDLSGLLDALDRLGVHRDPLADAEADDPLPRWRLTAGQHARAPLRGRVLGPAFRRGVLAAGRELQMQQVFLGGQQATIAIAAVPQDAVRLSVTGPDHAEACVDPHLTCRWMPIFTQRYTITVRNTGSQPARVYLVVD